MKLICAYRVSVGLSYDVNFKWHMPRCVVRYRAEQKYMPFFGSVIERAFRKKIPKHGNIYKMMLRNGIDFWSLGRTPYRASLVSYSENYVFNRPKASPGAKCML